MPTEEKEIQVARITSRQAIVVALITAIAGVSGAMLAVMFRPHEQAKAVSIVQHYLKMPLRFTGLKHGYAVRIVAEVNGQSYSYPSRAVWADVSQNMISESFPLPIGTDNFDVSFLVFLRNPNGSITTITNPRKPTVNVENHVSEQECTLVPLDDGFSRPHTLDDVVVKYEIQ